MSGFHKSGWMSACSDERPEGLTANSLNCFSGFDKCEKPLKRFTIDEWLYTALKQGFNERVCIGCAR